MKDFLWLQLFAEGEGEASGVTAPDAEEQQLKALGVPEDKLKKRAQRSARETVPTRGDQEPQQDAGQDAAVETEEPTKASRMTWKEIMADPEYNGEMQKLIQERVKNLKPQQEAMKALTPALELLAGRYGLAAGKELDGKALADAIMHDDSLYEDKAAEMGISPELARRLDRMEYLEKMQAERDRETEQERQVREHMAGLMQQAEELKKDIPSFDLQAELQNPAFVRLTAPGVGVSVMDAFYAVHRKEMQEMLQKRAAKETAEQLAASIQAGRQRPVENGTSAQAPTTTHFDYGNMTKEQRAALRQKIKEAAARGEKIYPV